MQGRVLINPEDIYVCLDFDGLLWDMRARLARQAEISLESWKEFFIPDNNFPPEIERRLMELLQAEDLFDDIEFFDGVEDIIRPELDFGVRVRIVGNITSRNELEKKREQLLAKVPRMKAENLSFRLVPLHHKGPKHLPEGTLFLADDLPFYIAKSTARYNVLPRYVYNSSAKAQHIMEHVNYRYFDTLNEINHFIYQGVQAYLHAGS